MNFEQLILIFNRNYWNLNFKKKSFFKKYLKYHYYLLNWKKNKLKLGLIFFDIKKIKVGNFVIYETIEMIHIRQDNTLKNELKLENRLKAIEWKWDFKNIFSLSLIIIFIFNNFLNYYYYYKNIILILPNYEKNTQFDLINLCFKFNFLKNSWNYFNNFTYDLLFNLIITYDLFF